MGSGGIGSFAQGFANSFQQGLQNRRLRDRMEIEQKLKIAKERRQEEQFNQNMLFKERSFEAAETRHDEDIDLRRESQEATQAHQKVLEENQRKSQDLQKRGQDIQVMDAWGKILDPKKPKAMRNFMFKQLSSSLQIDPKSQQYKDFEKMLSGMEDDGLKDIRSSLFAMMPDATPGQIQDISKSIISGDIPMKDAIETFNKAAKTKSTAGKLSMGSPPAGGGGDKQQPSRLMNPDPMARQGGDLPVPGMDSGSQEITHNWTEDQFRMKAAELAQDPEIPVERANLFLGIARDMAKAGEEKNSVKQIVTRDEQGNVTGEKWVRTSEAIGKEAPSGRAIQTREESAAIAEGDAMAKFDVERIKPIHEKGDTARDLLPQINTYRELLKTKRFETGTFSGIRQTLAQFARLTGMPDEVTEQLDNLKVGDPAIAESLDAVSKQIALTFAGDVSRLTNMSLELITGAVPSLLKTPEGNQIILEVYESKAKQAIEISDLAERYQEMGTLRPKGKPSFFEEKNKIMRKKMHLGEDFEDRLIAAKKLGESIDVDKIIGKSKKNLLTLPEPLGESSDFEITGKHESGLPNVRLSDGIDYPYADSVEKAKKLKPGVKFLWNDAVKGPHLRTAK